ncbi:sensor histidine kinase [Poseidonocella sedimentorum]|uniref:histidine kinase n=1 Tax=Poseidonocella sedimentorum TaxID=871652 RepID=A0A1I6DT76_9RHOB|nr:sensor histidine kinase [Poseidonocella sedimentorum]SFR08655.1 Two-component sensor histidine kinase, contains HisKA and HATPase domains [Poseidonocella sedimentorum]
MIETVRRRPFDGLGFRIAALLSLALFPIGLIAVSLTQQFTKTADRRAETALLALTAQAAASEEALIRAGFGTANALASVIPSIRGDQANCNFIFEDYIAKNPEYSFAGYVNQSGIVQCASDSIGFDVRDYTLYRVMRAQPEQRSDLIRNAPISKTSVIVLSSPVLQDGAFDGYIAVSLPHNETRARLETLPSERPIELITFNNEGEILSAEGGLEGAEGRLPAERDLQDFIGQTRTSFSGVTRNGEERVFAVVPIQRNQVYAIGSWPREHLAVAPGLAMASPLLFPIAMWITSLGVAYLAVHRLVIKHINHLGRDMRRFAATRRHDEQPLEAGVPYELREIDAAWRNLAETIVRDEAELEDTIHDKTVLLKEVHHRVKNNLQLIASIVNMKIRKAKTPEARTALKEVQGRVMSIATVHRSLYETTTEGRVRADELLRGTVGKLLAGSSPGEAGLDSSESYDAIVLYPDQAVPLSLLATEATTNALKYMGRPSDERPSFDISLEKLTSEAARLTVSNSKGIPLVPPEQVRGSGLGTGLITAFAQQLGGTLNLEDEDESYCVSVEFPIANFDETPAKAVTEADLEPSA